MCLVALAGCYLIPSALFAKPERIEIENKALRAKKVQAKAAAAQVDLSKVGDPEVRTALQAVFNSLNIKAKK